MVFKHFKGCISCTGNPRVVCSKVHSVIIDSQSGLQRTMVCIYGCICAKMQSLLKLIKAYMFDSQGNFLHDLLRQIYFSCMLCFVLSSLTWCFQKNAVGKIIIIYDEDERLAPHAATTLVERGVDNLFMLSGGQWCGILPTDYNYIVHSWIPCHNTYLYKL